MGPSRDPAWSRDAAMPASGPTADRNLLFGVLALQLYFVGQDDLIAALSAWARDKAKPLGQVLRERQALDDIEYQLLEGLVQKYLSKHRDDPRRTLAAQPPQHPPARQEEQPTPHPDRHP